MTCETLGLIQVGETLSCGLDTFKEPIEERFPLFHTQIEQPLVQTFEAYVSERHQYHSTRILVMLEGQIRDSGPDRLLGLTDYDLFAPGLNFVFGEARLPGRVGIVSTNRLIPSQTDAYHLLRQRIVKEITHEVGHMMGLVHCPNTVCVMHFSNGLSDTDIKSANLCSKCQSTLSKAPS